MKKLFIASAVILTVILTVSATALFALAGSPKITALGYDSAYSNGLPAFGGEIVITAAGEYLDQCNGEVVISASNGDAVSIMATAVKTGTTYTARLVLPGNIKNAVTNYTLTAYINGVQQTLSAPATCFVKANPSGKLNRADLNSDGRLDTLDAIMLLNEIAAGSGGDIWTPDYK